MIQVKILTNTFKSTKWVFSISSQCLKVSQSCSQPRWPLGVFTSTETSQRGLEKSNYRFWSVNPKSWTRSEQGDLKLRSAPTSCRLLGPDLLLKRISWTYRSQLKNSKKLTSARFQNQIVPRVQWCLQDKNLWSCSHPRNIILSTLLQVVSLAFPSRRSKPLTTTCRALNFYLKNSTSSKNLEMSSQLVGIPTKTMDPSVCKNRTKISW